MQLIKQSFTRGFDYTEEWRERAPRNSGNHPSADGRKVPIPGRKRNYNLKKHEKTTVQIISYNLHVQFKYVHANAVLTAELKIVEKIKRS